MSRTFSIIKPDATKRNLTGAINKIIEENNSEKLIQNPREDYTKQLVNAASPGWLNQITK